MSQINYKHTILCLSFLFCFIGGAFAKVNPLTIKEGFEGKRISGSAVWVLEEEKGESFDLSEVMNVYEKGSGGEYFNQYNFGLTTSAYWMVIEVENEDAIRRDLLLEVVNSYLFKFLVHRITQDGVLLKDSLTMNDRFHKRGKFINRSSREHRNFHFTFQLDPGEKTTWIFYFPAPKHILNFNFHVWDNEYRFTRQRDWEITMLHGFLMLCVVYLFFLTFAISITRFHYFWYYFVYVALGVCFVYTDLGQSYRYIWPEQQRLQQVAGPIFANLYLIAGILFFRKYFKTSQFYRQTDVVLKAIIVLAALIIPLVIATPSIDNVAYAHLLFRFANVLYVSTSIIFFIILFRSIFRGQRLFSGLFLFGFSIHGLHIILINLQASGVFFGGPFSALISGFGSPLTFYTNASLMLGMLLEMAVVFYISLRLFISIYKRNNEVLSDLAFQKEQNMNLLVMGIERERERIARDIHDGLGVMLASVKMKLNLFQENNIKENESREKITTIISELDNSHKELRNIARNLMPKALYKVGLVPAVEELVYRIKMLDDDFDVQFYTNMDFTNTSRLSQLYLFRIIQELLTNLVTHSRAKSASLQLVKHEDVLRLTMEDDGVGFDLSKKLKEGNGLNNIKYRVDALNGQVFFDSSPGKGSLISLEIPLTELNSHSNSKSASA